MSIIINGNECPVVIKDCVLVFDPETLTRKVATLVGENWRFLTSKELWEEQNDN